MTFAIVSRMRNRGSTEYQLNVDLVKTNAHEYERPSGRNIELESVTFGIVN